MPSIFFILFIVLSNSWCRNGTPLTKKDGHQIGQIVEKGSKMVSETVLRGVSVRWWRSDFEANQKAVAISDRMEAI